MTVTTAFASLRHLAPMPGAMATLPFPPVSGAGTKTGGAVHTVGSVRQGPPPRWLLGLPVAATHLASTVQPTPPACCPMISPCPFARPGTPTTLAQSPTPVTRAHPAARLTTSTASRVPLARPALDSGCPVLSVHQERSPTRMSWGSPVKSAYRGSTSRLRILCAPTAPPAPLATCQGQSPAPTVPMAPCLPRVPRAAQPCVQEATCRPRQSRPFASPVTLAPMHHRPRSRAPSAPCLWCREKAPPSANTTAILATSSTPLRTHRPVCPVNRASPKSATCACCAVRATTNPVKRRLAASFATQPTVPSCWAPCQWAGRPPRAVSATLPVVALSATSVWFATRAPSPWLGPVPTAQPGL